MYYKTDHQEHSHTYHMVYTPCLHRDRFCPWGRSWDLRGGRDSSKGRQVIARSCYNHHQTFMYGLSRPYNWAYNILVQMNLTDKDIIEQHLLPNMVCWNSLNVTEIPCE